MRRYTVSRSAKALDGLEACRDAKLKGEDHAWRLRVGDFRVLCADTDRSAASGGFAPLVRVALSGATLGEINTVAVRRRGTVRGVRLVVDDSVREYIRRSAAGGRVRSGRRY